MTDPVLQLCILHVLMMCFTVLARLGARFVWGSDWGNTLGQKFYPGYGCSYIRMRWCICHCPVPSECY